MTLQQLLTKLRAKELEAIENGGVAEVHFVDLADAQRAIVELIERDSDMGGGELPTHYCYKCGYLGNSELHAGCYYRAAMRPQLR